MVYYESAYIRRYKKQSNYTNKDNKKIKREIETVETRGLKKTSKFKDKQEIIIISKQDFNTLQSQINELQETNNKLMNTINNNDLSNNNNKMELKLIELLETINNRNELLLNANEQFNNIIDVIINELQKEYIKLINEVNKENKKKLDLLINEIQTEQTNLINKHIGQELKEINKGFNNIGFIELYRKRKKININLDLKPLQENNINLDPDFLLTPNFNNINTMKIKENAKNNIDFNKLYINFSKENKYIDL